MADENIKSTSPTYIHGIGSSQAIDTAGEIVDLAGLDCSSLVGGSFNFEHNSSVPAAIVGKVLEYKKIFSEKDCENDSHKYFWDKCKTPYLYVMGRLFDDKKPSAKEIAALFIDDAEHPDEPPSIGFSIEGSKVSKSGIIVDKSIARRVTCTGAPANKTCVAELVPNPDLKDSTTDTDSIFKSEPSHTIELLEKAETKHEKGVHQPLASMSAHGSKNSEDKTLQGMSSMGYNVRNPRPTMVDPKVKASQKLEEQRKIPKPDLGKKEVPGSNIPSAHPAPTQSKPLSGVPGWSHSGGGNFNHPEHGTVSVIKEGGKFNVKHGGGLAGIGGKKGSFGSMNEAGRHAGDYMRGLSQGKTAGTEMHQRPSPSMAKGEVPGSKYKPKEKNPTNKPQETAAPPKFGPMPPKKDKPMKKAMSAGSGMCAPGNLSGGAALSKESLDKKMKKTEESDRYTKVHGLYGAPNLNPGESYHLASHSPHTGALHYKGAVSSRKGLRSAAHKRDNKHGAAMSHKVTILPPKPSLGKSEWLARAEQEYSHWEKREQFENFMAKHMPSLTKGEISAIGQTLALRKSLRAERKLAKMVDQGQDSYVNKKEK